MPDLSYSDEDVPEFNHRNWGYLSSLSQEKSEKDHNGIRTI
jgi:hypothetical protein